MQLRQKAGGVLLVTPEHRLSLILKYYELFLDEHHWGMTDPTAGQRCRVLELLKRVVEYEAVDLLDEADEILRHKFQLVYAIGDRLDLEQGAERWSVLMALFRIIQKSERLHKLFEDHSMAVLFTRSAAAHEFHTLRFPAATEFI